MAAVSSVRCSSAIEEQEKGRARKLQTAHRLCCKLGSATSRGQEEARTIYEIEGKVTFAKSETDRDIHLVIEDLETGRIIVAEIVDPDCPEARDSPHVEALRANWRAFLDTVGNVRSSLGELVRVQGVGFFDKQHGQKGGSES
jgi:hypothetical protein